MKYRLDAVETDIDFVWEGDAGDDLMLYACWPGVKNCYWGIVCPHKTGIFQVVAGDVFVIKTTLKEAKRTAEELCAREILEGLTTAKPTIPTT